MTTEKTAAPRRGRKKGSAKTGGRRKGTPNRNSLNVLGALDKAGIPVIEFLVTDIQTLEPKERIPEWKALLAFCYPKLKDLEPAERPPSLPGDAPPATSAVKGLTNAQLLQLVNKQPEPKANA